MNEEECPRFAKTLRKASFLEGSSSALHEITVISKKGCHLCEQVIGTLESLEASESFRLVVLDIEEDRALFDAYWIKIPVVRVDGKDVFEVEDIALKKDCEEKLRGLVQGLGG